MSPSVSDSLSAQPSLQHNQCDNNDGISNNAKENDDNKEEDDHEAADDDAMDDNDKLDDNDAALRTTISAAAVHQHRLAEHHHHQYVTIYHTRWQRRDVRGDYTTKNQGAVIVN